MTLTVDLQSQGQADYLVFIDLLYFRLYTWYGLDLHVNFEVFDVRDLAIVILFHVTLTNDHENQGQSYLLWPHVHHGLYTW